MWFMVKLVEKIKLSSVCPDGNSISYKATPHKVRLNSISACIFRHFALKFLAKYQLKCTVSIQFDEKFVYVSAFSILCGIALKR